MQIYVLTREYYHENSDLIGVFSTLEAARAAADEVPTAWPGFDVSAVVTEVSLDAVNDPEGYGYYKDRAYYRLISE